VEARDLHLYLVDPCRLVEEADVGPSYYVAVVVVVAALTEGHQICDDCVEEGLLPVWVAAFASSDHLFPVDPSSCCWAVKVHLFLSRSSEEEEGDHLLLLVPAGGVVASFLRRSSSSSSCCCCCCWKEEALSPHHHSQEEEVHRASSSSSSVVHLFLMAVLALLSHGEPSYDCLAVAHHLAGIGLLLLLLSHCLILDSSPSNPLFPRPRINNQSSCLCRT